ncbi:hypothetical protein LCGC14_2491700, partial [marine sediment metagenome]
MTHTTITANDFLKGCRPRPRGAHPSRIPSRNRERCSGIRQGWEPGRGYIRRHTDNRTVYAYVKRDFYIGG